MPTIQAKIYYHGVPQDDTLTIGEPCDVYAHIEGVGALPVTALIEMRKWADAQNIKAAMGLPQDEAAEFVAQYELDPTRTEVFVDPHEFMVAGTDCIQHRFILVEPMSISLEDMPPLVTTED